MCKNCGFQRLARLMLKERQGGQRPDGRTNMRKAETILASLLWVAAVALLPLLALQPVPGIGL
jgi:hypothetical protein